LKQREQKYKIDQIKIQ